MDDENLKPDSSWSMKIDEARPKHFIKFIGRCITAGDNSDTLLPKNQPFEQVKEPPTSLKNVRDKNRVQLGVRDRFLEIKSKVTEVHESAEPQALNSEDAQSGNEQSSEQDAEDMRDSKTSLKSHSSECSDDTELTSDLESELSRSMVGLMQQALAAPRVKHQLLSEIAGSDMDLTGLELSPTEKLRIQRARTKQPPEEVFGPRDKMAPDVFVQKTIEQNGIVIFASSKCPFCARLQYVLEMHERNYTMLRLDKMGSYGKVISQYLTDNWLELNVPNVYFHGKHFDGKFISKDLSGDLSDLRKDLVLFDPSLYDLIVIGGGPDGSAAAIQAAELKKKVCLIDCIDVSRDRPFWVLGKTGLNIGSIPKRYLYQAAIDCIDLYDSKHYGWNEQSFLLKWSSLVRDIWRELKRTNWEYRVNLRKAGVTYLNCEAKMLDKNTVEVFNRETKKFILKSRYILLALGAEAYIPKIPGAEFCITSDEVFLQQRIPGRVLIFGGSTVAVEYAFILRQLGFPTALMVPGTLMRTVDREILDEITKRMDLLGIEVLRECLIVRVEPIKTTKDAEPDEGKTASSYSQQLKNQLFEFSEDYIHLWKSDNESNVDLQKRDSNIESDVEEEHLEETQEDGRKSKSKHKKYNIDKVNIIFKELKTQTNNGEEFNGSFLMTNHFDGLSRFENGREGYHSSSNQNIEKVSNAVEHTNTVKGSQRTFIQKKCSLKNKPLKIKGKQSKMKKRSSDNTKISIKKKSNICGIKSINIFSTCCMKSFDKVLNEGNVNDKTNSNFENQIKAEANNENSTTLAALLSDLRKNDNSSSDIISGGELNHDRTCKDGPENTFDGPKKGKGKKGKGKKDKKKKGKKKKKPKKPLKPAETNSQKELREKNENLLRLLSKIITTKKLSGPGLGITEPNINDSMYEGQPCFSVVGLFGNGYLHKANYNTIVIAAGDETNSGNIGLTNVGVNVNPGTGKVYTNTKDQTSLANIYAVGSMVEGKALGTSASVCSAINVVKRIFTKNKARMDYSSASDLLLLPPSEYSYVGLAEERARDTLPGVIHVYKKWFRPLDTIFSHRNTARSFIKVVAHVERPRMEKVVGIHIFGRNAGYTIQGFTLAVRRGLYIHDLEKLIATDLTNAERLTNIELEEDEKLIEVKIEGDDRKGWEEELKELQELHSSEEEPPVEEEDEPPEEIIIALERVVPVQVAQEEV